MNKKMILGGTFALAIGLLALPSLAGSGSGGTGTTPVPTVVSPGPILVSPNLCPSGWHVQAGTKTTSGAFTCQPNKTSKMMTCPIGTEFFDNGCVVGCQVPIK